MCHKFFDFTKNKPKINNNAVPLPIAFSCAKIEDQNPNQLRFKFMQYDNCNKNYCGYSPDKNICFLSFLESDANG